ncbi:hypothetical protein SAMN05216357_102260 [Porphyromonadaceae bacterium KH3CP3RA]|nr:hypothetical protein SAMN05216357_102260 [Porphyromonadaceae bacterium KH3CP3RA]
MILIFITQLYALLYRNKVKAHSYIKLTKQKYVHLILMTDTLVAKNVNFVALTYLTVWS